MKFLVVLAAFVALSAGNAIPLVPGDNSHYVEGESRYIWMTGGDDVPHLVDLHQGPEEDILRNRNGANNEYWLFTRSNPNTAQIIVHGNANTIWSSNYVANRPLKVIVHGWTGNGGSNVNTLVRQAFLDTVDANVIILDWRALASSGYITAVSGVPSVGQFLGNFLDWLIRTAGGNWNNVHLVGYSLGAHIVGNAGRTIGGRVARITGLDPAGPLWNFNSNALRSTDGQYVEAIHTDGGLQGIMNPIGTANFYPNGGRNPQPGCSDSNCSHRRSFQFFAATVTFNHLIGRQCTDVAQAQLSACSGSSLHMGNGVLSKRGNGIFGLVTGSSWPF